MLLDSLLREFDELNLSDVDKVIRWLHRILRVAIEMQLPELPNQKTIATRIAKANNIALSIDPPLFPRTTIPRDPYYARWILETAVLTFQFSSGKDVALAKHYETIVINAEFYLRIKR